MRQRLAQSRVLQASYCPKPNLSQMRIAAGIFDKTLAKRTAAYDREKHTKNFKYFITIINTAEKPEEQETFNVTPNNSNPVRLGLKLQNIAS